MKDRVRIRRKGIPAKGWGGDHEIPYSQLVSIKLESGWGGGYIYFVVAGQEDEAGRKDKYQVSFGASQREHFEKIEQHLKLPQAQRDTAIEAAEEATPQPSEDLSTAESGQHQLGYGGYKRDQLVLADVILKYTRKGYKLISQTETTATMRMPAMTVG